MGKAREVARPGKQLQLLKAWQELLDTEMLNDISVSDVRQFQFYLPKKPTVDLKS